MDIDTVSAKCQGFSISINFGKDCTISSINDILTAYARVYCITWFAQTNNDLSFFCVLKCLFFFCPMIMDDQDILHVCNQNFFTPAKQDMVKSATGFGTYFYAKGYY